MEENKGKRNGNYFKVAPQPFHLRVIKRHFEEDIGTET